MDDLVSEVDGISEDIADVKVYDIPVLIIFVILFFIVVLQFFTRYVLNDSMSWTEEIARYFLVLLGFVGSATCIRRKSHIFLEFFYRYLPKFIVLILEFLCEFIGFLFVIYCTWLSWELANKTQGFMVSIQVSKSIIYYIVCIGFFISAIFAFVNLIKILLKLGSKSSGKI